MKIAIIADDLTGANDSGVQLAKAGLDTVVWLNGKGSSENRAEAVVVDTDSRALSPKEAKAAVHAAMSALAPYNPNLIFKKVDSTLRGNVGAELEATAEAWQPECILLAPSFPANNRTVEDGILYVNGTPIGETEFARNEADPVSDSAISDHIGRQFHGAIAHIPESLWAEKPETISAWLDRNIANEQTVFICDAVSMETLERIAAFSQQQPKRLLLAGSAGLSNALAQTMVSGTNTPFADHPVSSDPILYLVGSMSEVSKTQVAHLLTHPQTEGIRLHAATAASNDRHTQAKEFERVVAAAEKTVATGKIPVIFSGTERQEVAEVYDYAKTTNTAISELAKRIADTIAAIGSKLMDTRHFQAIIMTGGDTAKALCRRLSIDELRLLDEFEPGIPVAQFTGEHHQTYAITKAGAFGNEKTFSNLYHHFTKEESK
ncbi:MULTISPECIES: four-carbon acid sugar kinase family protein [Shouchella]|uniref:Four-carbon acid sugar kinase family protein n=2 Tax=Shouchella TaxID=2893057 RepID=A0A268NW38_SHOCL|nr:four-carbon acid sugar kinase family protein [Shouchella clausii]MDO7268779.1 four-carbon acid sugar kinase family protein [Shouchella clausii]MDO7289006.1 four-carbon acid sugar kinase family protein [Shouchella clausii]PAE87300.1 hypothetical protein CHH72_19150 [Shouchella clausii]